MAGSAEDTSDGVQICLVDLDASPINTDIRERRVVLNESSVPLVVGRSSKASAKGFIAGKGNAWFDSQVMSRRHAEISVGSKKEVLIRDLGSLHGTFVNDEPETIQQSRELKDGDKIKFGTPVMRGSERFTPTTVKVGISLDYRSSLPNTFRVPEGSDDGSDIEEILSGDTKTVDLDTLPHLTHMIDLTIPDRTPSCGKGFGGRYPAPPEIIDMTSPPSSPASGRSSPVIIPDDDDDDDDDDDHDEADENDEVDYPDDDEYPENGGDLLLDSFRGEVSGDFRVPSSARFSSPDVNDVDTSDEGDRIDDEDYISDRSIRFSSHEDLSDSDSVTSAKGDCNSEQELESDEECGYGHHPSDSDDEELVDTHENDDFLDEEDNDGVEPFWSHATAATTMSALQEPQMPTPLYDPPRLRTSSFTIGSVLNEDKPGSSLHSFAIPDPAPTVLANTPALASMLPRQPSPSDVIMSKSFLSGKVGSEAGTSKDGIWNKTDESVTKSLQLQEAAAVTECSPAIAPVVPVNNSKPLVDPNGEELVQALPSPPAASPPVALLLPNLPLDPVENFHRTYLSISDIVEVSQHGADKQSGKRKIDEISTLSDGEKAWELEVLAEQTAPLSPSSSPLVLSANTPRLASEPANTLLGNSPKAPTSEASVVPQDETVKTSQISKPEDHALNPVQFTGERPPKRQRLRNIAERVGYAALGGVTAGAMIFGTLVYTAPSFS